MPRYECVDGKQTKFWEIELDGDTHSLKWGKVGGSTSMSTKTHADDAAARKAADKLINEKLKAGFALVGGAPAGKTVKASKKPAAEPAAPSGPARNAALEKAILANLDDPEPYLVYADWMQSNGEIRGELAVLQHAGKTKEANALIKKFGDWFLGGFAKDKPETFELEWFCGYVKSATISWPAFSYDLEDDGEGFGEKCKQELVAFLRHPTAQFLQQLHLGTVPGEEEMSNTALAEAIDEVKPPCLRELYIDDVGDWDISSTSTAMPDSKSIKGVRVLHLRAGNIGLDKQIDLPELREFSVETGGLGKDELKSIANAKWPKLEKLVIWCGDPNYGASGGVKDLAPIFAGTGLPKLEHLAIANCPFADEVAKQLVKAKIVAQLETLDLSRGNLSSKGLDTLVAAKDAFAHLALLDLDDNALVDTDKPKLKGLAKKANWGTQDSPERAVPRAEDRRWYRYVAVGE